MVTVGMSKVSPTLRGWSMGRKRVSEGAVEAPFDALAALRRLPQLDVRLDLPGVALEVVGVDREPVLGRVAPRLRVPALAHPRRLGRSEEHTSELQSLAYLVCRLLLEKKKTDNHVSH